MGTNCRLIGVVLLVSLSWAFAANAQTKPDWRELLRPGGAAVPPPAFGKVTWRDNLTNSLAEAVRTDRPLFITLRCLPCKQCSDFDKEVLEGGSDLDPLLKQFVTVRLTDAAQVDLRLLPMEQYQDLDLSWWGWFLSPKGEIYGVYGGKDHTSESNRISKASLVTTMKRILDHHYDSRRLSAVKGSNNPALSKAAYGPRDLPGFKSWDAKREKHEVQGTCIHCHQVQEIIWQPLVDRKAVDKETVFDLWPLPENVGITVERDDGLKVTAVRPDSPADKAGIRAGDMLAVADETRLFSQADFRAALHRCQDNSVEIYWLRGGEVKSAELQMTNGWRKTNVGWKMTASQGNIGANPAFFPLKVNAGRKKQYKLAPDTWAIEPYMGSETNSASYKAGLRGNYLVTAINGEKPNLGGRDFLVWFKKRFDPGDEVTVTYTKPSGESATASYRVK